MPKQLAHLQLSVQFTGLLYDEDLSDQLLEGDVRLTTTGLVEYDSVVSVVVGHRAFLFAVEMYNAAAEQGEIQVHHGQSNKGRLIITFTR